MKNKFMFKSSWFDNMKILTITHKGLYLYCKLRELVELEGKNEFNVEQLAKWIGCTKKNTIRLLDLLKSEECVEYYAPFLTYNHKRKIYNWEERFSLKFLDLPRIEKKFDESKGHIVELPINDENHFVVVDMEIVNRIKGEKLKKEHVITYLLLSTFKEGKCNIGFKRMQELLGIEEDELRSIICVELEMKGFICNYGNEENNFIVLRDINDYEKFKERHAEKIKNKK